MSHQPIQHNRLRRGLSFLEFTGYLVAMSIGMIGGSIYLGIDLQSVAVGVLEEAELIEPGSMGEDELEETDASEVAMEEKTVKVQATTTTTENSGSDNATLAMSKETTSANTEIDEQPSTLPSLTEEQCQLRTHQYWLALVACMSKELNERVSGVQDPGNWQLYDYLTQRSKGHSSAVETIQQLQQHGVDPRLLAHGQVVLTWHRAGQKLYGRAVDLLTDAPSADLIGPFAQSWQSSATQHRMEEKLLRDKHGAVSGYLNHTYKPAGEFVPAFSK